MRSLNKIKKNIRDNLIEEKFEISKSYVINLKNELVDVFKKYTKSEDFSIDLSVKVLKSNQYKIEVCTRLNDLI